MQKLLENRIFDILVQRGELFKALLAVYVCWATPADIARDLFYVVWPECGLSRFDSLFISRLLLPL